MSQQNELIEALAAWTGMATGIVGAVLGGLSLWKQELDSKPRLRVRAGVWNAIAERYDGRRDVEEDIGIFEIANVGRVDALGPFKIWFENESPSRSGKNALLIPWTTSVGGGPVPLKLAPGEIAHIRFDPASLVAALNRGELGRPCAALAVGTVFKGSRAAKRKIIADILAFGERRKKTSEEAAGRSGDVH